MDALNSRKPDIVLWVSIALLLALAMFVRPINHDEGQYVAATALIRQGLPYRDFAYLQTPLQPLLLAPLSHLPPGWLLVASRGANALFAFASVALVVLGVRKIASKQAALVAAALMAFSDVFLFAASVARNDALPLVLLAAGVAAVLAVMGGWRRRWIAVAGLMFGLATSAKISFALPAAGAALFFLIRIRSYGWPALAVLIAGGIAGLLPTIVLGLLAPEAFWFQVIEYSLTAPQQWWASAGSKDWLNPGDKLLLLLGLAARGPILLALIVVLIDRRTDPRRLFLDLMIIGGLIAAYLPDPPFKQYLVPLLPPLFASFALAFEHLPKRALKPVLLLCVVFSLLGVSRTAKHTVRALGSEPELSIAVRQARAVDELSDGTVVTLSPERVAGVGIDLHPAFVTGPFLFRTDGQVAARARRYGFGWNWASLYLLDGRPPNAIVTGGEHESAGRHRAGLDHYLVKWAKARGYRQRPLPGDFTIFLRPNEKGRPQSRPSRFES